LTNFDFLQGLPNLTSFDCSFLRGGSDAQLADRLVAAVQHCTNITRLRLDRCRGLTAVPLAELLPRLPRLQSLVLDSLRIDSLSFLAQSPLTGQLSSLTLSYCSQLPVGELRHLHELRGLRELLIYGLCDEKMEPGCHELMALPAALPLLESFTYLPRIFEFEDGHSDQEQYEEEEFEEEEEDADPDLELEAAVADAGLDPDFD